MVVEVHGRLPWVRRVGIPRLPWRGLPPTKQSRRSPRARRGALGITRRPSASSVVNPGGGGGSELPSWVPARPCKGVGSRGGRQRYSALPFGPHVGRRASSGGRSRREVHRPAFTDPSGVALGMTITETPHSFTRHTSRIRLPSSRFPPPPSNFALRTSNFELQPSESSRCAFRPPRQT